MVYSLCGPSMFPDWRESSGGLAVVYQQVELRLDQCFGRRQKTAIAQHSLSIHCISDRHRAEPRLQQHALQRTLPFRGERNGHLFSIVESLQPRILEQDTLALGAFHYE